MRETNLFTKNCRLSYLRVLIVGGLFLFPLCITSCKVIVSNVLIRKYAARTGLAYPDINAENLDGDSVSLNDSSGTIKYVHIWATWCSPCIGGLPALNDITKKMEEYKDIRTVNICIDTPEKREKWKQLVRDHQILGENYFITPDNSFMKTLDLDKEGFPSFLLVGKDRKILGSELSPDQGILTIYLLTRAREGVPVKESFKDFWRQAKRMKKHDDEETRRFVAFLEKYNQDSLKLKPGS